VNAAYRDPVLFYRDHAAAFDAERTRNLNEKVWLDDFLALLPKGGAVLDAGCGAGDPIGRYIACGGFDVTGIDTTDEFLRLAMIRVPSGRFVNGDLRNFDLDQEFDGIIAWDSFFHLDADQQILALRRFGNHAKVEAAMLFNTGPERGEAINPLFDEPLFHASLSPTEYRSILGEMGFTVVQHRANDPDCGGRTVWLAHRSSRYEDQD
jgi:SAM-dependent methyltransferase